MPLLYIACLTTLLLVTSHGAAAQQTIFRSDEISAFTNRMHHLRDDVIGVKTLQVR